MPFRLGRAGEGQSQTSQSIGNDTQAIGMDDSPGLKYFLTGWMGLMLAVLRESGGIGVYWRDRFWVYRSVEG
jgi:hypothetical protein